MSSTIFKLDLHVHTVLSPCTEISDMTPKAIVNRAVEVGLDGIAVCDHNSCRNVGAAMKAGLARNIAVFAGIEITTREEVHIVGLLPSLAAALEVQEEIYARLPGENNEEVFGYQVVVDENDFVEDLDNRLLIGATTLSIEKIVRLIHDNEGLCVAAHIDRKGFGLVSQLGFIPANLELDALEISRNSNSVEVAEKYNIRDRTILTSSDAHYLQDIGSAYTKFLMEALTFDELKMAIRKLNGRMLVM